jgi:hypothetical protein
LERASLASPCWPWLAAAIWLSEFSAVAAIEEGSEIMNRFVAALSLAAVATPCLAGVGPAPAPLLAAGLPGLAVLAVAGGGYLAVRVFRRRGD